MKVEKLTEKISQRDKSITDLNYHILKDIVELRKVYVYTIIQKIYLEKGENIKALLNALHNIQSPNASIDMDTIY